MEAQTLSGEKASFAAAREKFESVVERLQSAGALAMTHGELEALIEPEGREVMRLLLQGHLRARRTEEPAVVEVLGSDGVARRHRRVHARPLMTIFGPVVVERTAYGARGSASLHPLDEKLNLPQEVYSHGVRRRIAEEVARGAYEEAIGSLARNTGAQVPKRQAEQLAVRAAADFEGFYRARRAASAREEARSGSIVVLTSDGKGVPMRKEHLREATRKAGEKSPHRLKRRLSKGEKNNRKRMATVASVYTIAPCIRTADEVLADFKPVKDAARPRPRPEKKRVWACIEKDVEPVLRDVYAEALRRDPARQKTWVGLVDGNKTQLELLHALAEENNVDLTIILDVIHVIEYLWKAAWAFHREGDPAAEAWVNERVRAILEGKSSEVAGGIRRSATLRRLRGDRRKAADKCAGYLVKYRRYLRYDQYLATGLPIATGVVEGACRYLVKDRLEVTGAHWSVNGAEAVLRLRSLRASGDFDAYWSHHLKQELGRNHSTHYDRPAAPSRPGHLRLVT